MPLERINGKRVLVLGAETEVGQVVVKALAGSNASFAVVAAGTDAQTAFEVQRLARGTGATASQAVDATNEMAVRVMIRQLAKRLGGLDLLLFCAHLGEWTADALALAAQAGGREMARSGGGAIVAALPEGQGPDIAGLVPALPEGVRVVEVDVPEEPDEAWAKEVIADVA